MGEGRETGVMNRGDEESRGDADRFVDVELLDFLDKILTFFEEWTLFVSVIVALLALFVNVVLRYGFNYSLAWSEELVREVIIYTTFIG